MLEPKLHCASCGRRSVIKRVYHAFAPTCISFEYKSTQNPGMFNIYLDGLPQDINYSSVKELCQYAFVDDTIMRDKEEKRE